MAISDAPGGWSAACGTWRCRRRQAQRAPDAPRTGRSGPQWPGEGPLSYIASVACAEVRKIPLDLVLPDAASLLFFYFDGQSGDSEPAVDSWAL